MNFKLPQREIKFRAWDKERKKMVKVGEMGFDQKEGVYYVGSTNGDKLCSVVSVEGILLEKKFILMQYTGLKDKNGKEIYEGDIVRRNDGLLRVVKWMPYCFYLEDVQPDKEGRIGREVLEEKRIELLGYKVIGNIFENPELLKGRKNKKSKK